MQLAPGVFWEGKGAPYKKTPINKALYWVFDGRSASTNFERAPAIEPFTLPFLGPVEPVFLEAERLAGRVA